MHGALHADAHDRAAAGDVDGVSDQGCAQPVARRRHRGRMAPCRRSRGRRPPSGRSGDAFVAHHEDLAPIERRAMAGAGGRQRAEIGEGLRETLFRRAPPLLCSALHSIG